MAGRTLSPAFVTLCGRPITPSWDASFYPPGLVPTWSALRVPSTLNPYPSAPPGGHLLCCPLGFCSRKEAASSKPLKSPFFLLHLLPVATMDFWKNGESRRMRRRGSSVPALLTHFKGLANEPAYCFSAVYSCVLQSTH